MHCINARFIYLRKIYSLAYIHRSILNGARVTTVWCDLLSTVCGMWSWPMESYSGTRKTIITTSFRIGAEIETPRGRERGEGCPLTIRLGVRGPS